MESLYCPSWSKWSKDEKRDGICVECEGQIHEDFNSIRHCPLSFVTHVSKISQSET
jgi:hypothetical protein